MAPTANNPSYDRSSLVSFQVIPVPRNSGTKFKLEGMYVTGSRYILIHFFCLAVEAVFCRDVVECLPVDPATWV